MNYSGRFGSGDLDSFSSTHVKLDTLSHRGHDADAITIPDAHLLFSGEFQRFGSDLIISGDHQRVVVPDYFHGSKRPALVSPEGAAFDPKVIEALTGHTAYAQAGNPPAAKVVGHVAKMTGSASIVRNGVTVVLNNGDAVYQNDVVQTGSGSTLGLVLIDGTTFNLTANARLMLNDLTYDPASTSNSSLFTMVQGAANFVAGQVARTGDMKVATPVASIGIRGTAVILDISSANGEVSISVIDQQDGQVHAVQVFNTRGDLIGTVTSNGSMLTLTPTATFEVIARESNKTVERIAQEFSAFQAVLNTYEIQKAIDPNLPQHTENSGGKDSQPTKYASLGSTPANPVVTETLSQTGAGTPKSDSGVPIPTPIVVTVQPFAATGPSSNQPQSEPIVIFAPVPVPFVVTAPPVPFVVTPATVSKVSSGTGDHFGPVMSADGQFVTYDPDGTIYLFDRNTGATSTIESPSGGFTYGAPTISSDGRFVVYQRSDGVVIIYNNDSSDPAHYQHKTLIGPGTSPAISGDGSRILVEHGGNIVVYDQQGHLLSTITPAAVGASAALWKPAVSADGHVIAFWGSDAATAGGPGHLYSYNVSTGVITSIAATAGEAGITSASISADGHYVVYQSADANGHSEIYLYDLSTGNVIFQTSNSANGSYNPVISPDGHFIIFASDAQLNGDDTNSVADTYVVDVTNPAAPIFKLVSALADGTQGNAASNLGATISAGGLFIAFGSSASNFSSGDGPGGDIFVVDPNSGRSVIINETLNSPAILSASGLITLTGDNTGTMISFSGDPSRFTASFNAQGNIQWTFNEAKSDFAGLAYGQDASQQFVITLNNGVIKTTIPVTVIVHNGIQPVVPVVTVPGSIVGDNLDNTLTGTTANDIFQGFGGNDTIIGLTGVDRAVYADATGGITADLAAGTVFGPGVGSDTLIGVEAIQGSNFVDHYSAAGFIGDAGVPGVPLGFNSFEGMAGDDVITGNINVQGQALTRVSYLTATAAVTVDFGAGTGTGNASVGTDHFTNVNAVIGSNFGDTLLGSNNSNGTYEQFEGRGGNDFIDGRGGYDFVTYNNDPAISGITVNMAAGTVTGDTTIGTDTLRHVEGVRGTKFADTYNAVGFSGGSANAGSSGTFNNFDGQGGDDTIIGNGNTRIQYSNSTAAVNVDFVTGTATGDASVGTDHFTGVNAAMGSIFGDTLLGSAGNENFMGLAGNDLIDGRGGFDIAQYNNMTYTTGGISVDLVGGIVTGDASIGVDTLRSIETVQGTNFADTFDATNFGAAGYLNAAAYNVGDFGAFNQFEGLGGNDQIVGNANTHLIYGSSTGALTINMAAGTVDGDASVGHDAFSGVIGVNGGNLADVYDATNFTGGAYGPFNTFEGAGGNDTIIGNGNTQVTYFSATAGVTVDLQAGTADGNASVGHDSLTGGVNGIVGSNFGDFLYGNSGANFLNGQNGDDLLDGRGGSGDFLNGGSGTDTFVYASGYGATTIGDFIHSDGDRVDLTGLTGVYSLADLQALAQPLNGNLDTFIDFGNGDTLLLTGVSLSSLVDGDFLFASAPTIISVTDDAAPVTGTLTIGDITNDTDLTVKVSLTGTGVVAGDTVQLYNGSGTGSQLGISYTLLASDINNGFANVQTGTLSNGSTYAITARVTDAAGNQSVVSTNTFTVTEDTVAPAETISGTIGTDTGATTTIASGGLTKDNTLTLSGTVSDASGVSSVQVFDGASLLGTAAVSSGTWSFTTAALSEGSHSLTAKATDIAGNVTTTSAVTATVDTTPPSESLSGTIGTDTGATTTITSGGLTRDNTLALSGTVSDASGVSSVQVFDGASLLGTAAVSSGTWSFTTAALSEGSHSLTARATDIAGNVTITSAVTATVDTTNPAETLSGTIGTDTGATTTITSGGLTKDKTLALSGTVSDANLSSVHVFDGATDLGTATVSGGNWSFTTGPLTDGSYSFTAKATDNAGNVTTTSAVTATVDTTPPSESMSNTIGTDTGATTTITSGGLTKDNTLALSGTVSDANLSSVHVFDGATDLGAATISGGNWSFTTGPLTDGSHIFTAKATDTVGNSSTVGVITATVDTTNPGETLSSTIGTDTGATTTITSGGLTKDNTLALSGTVSDASGVSSVQVFDGANLLGTATVSSGNWSFATAALSEGSHSFTARATDNAGNVTTASAVTATIDTTAPTVTITAAGGSTNQAVQIITGTVGAGDIGTTVTLFDNGGATPLGTAVVQNDGSWSTSVTLSGNGTHSIVAKDTDAAGNAGTSSAVIYTLSTVGPAVTASLTTDTGSSASDKITSNDVLTGTGDANTLVTLTEGATVLGTTTSNGAGVWSFTPAGLSDGLHTIVASQTDGFGNTGTASLSFTLDTTAPAETISGTIGTDTGATTTIASGGLTKDNTLTLSGTVSDAIGVSSVQVFDGASLLGTAAVSSGTWSFTTAALSEGSHSLTARATDIAGNVTTTSAVTATVDTTPPSESLSGTIGTDTGATTTITSGGLTRDNTLALSGTVSDASGVSSVQVFDGASLLGTAAVSSGTWSFTTAALSEGSHSLTARATDIAGNVTITSAVTATVDTTNPAETLSGTIGTDTGATTTITSGGLTKDNTLALSGTVSDASGVSSVQVFDGANLLGTATVSSGNWSFATAALSEGSHSFTARATDNAGNVTTASAVTATIDTTAPTVTITAAGGSTNQAVQIITGTVGAADIGTTVTLFDNGGATPLGTAVVQNDGSWSTSVTLSGNGTHSIVAKDTDAAGNAGTSSAVIYTLSTVGPAVTASLTTDTGSSASDKITSNNVLTGTGDANTLVTLTEGATVLGTTTSNGAGVWSFTPAGLSDGLHTIVASQTDGFGNTGTASLSFTLDTTAPAETISGTIGTDTGATTTITSGGLTKDNTLTLSGTVSDAIGVSSVQVFDGANLLGTAAVSSGTWSFTTAALSEGSHSLTARATDIAGNVTTTSAVTATIDTTAPAAGTLALANFADTGSSGSDFISQDKTFDLSLSGQEGGATVVYQISTNGGSTWSTTTPAQSNLADGSYQFRTQVTDAAANTSTSNVVSVTVDSTAPAAGTLALANFSDTGSSGSDFISQDKSFDLSLSGQGSGTVVYQISTNGGSTWSTTTPAQSNLADGSYQFRTQVTDAAGNTSTSNVVSVTVDSTAPAAGTLALANFSDTGSSGSDFISQDKTFDLSLSGQGSGTVVYQISTNGGSTWTTTTAPQSNLADGGYQFRTQVTDAAGNTSTSNVVSVTVDSTAPAAGTLALANFSDTGSSGSDFISQDKAFDLSLSGQGPGTVVYQISTNGGGTWTTTTAAQSNLADGSYQFRTQVTDAAGNTSTSNVVSVTVDSTAPAAPAGLMLDPTTDTGTPGDNQTSVSVVKIDGTAESGSTVTLYDTDGTTILGSGVASGGTFSITTSSLIPGTHTITAKATDAAGNTGVASTSLAVTVDTSAPTETLAITSVAGSSSPTNKTITVSGSNSPLAIGDKVQISTDGSTWTDVVQNSLRTWSFADSFTHTGNFIYRTRIVDIAANVGATATQAVLVAYNGGTVSVGASSALVAEFTGTGGTLQLNAGITGTVNAISVSTGSATITGSGSVTTATGDAIDLYATGGTQALSINLNGPITGAASGIVAAQNASGAITIATSGPVTGLAGRGILAQQTATGVGSILINGSGNVTGTGTGFSGIVAQNLNTANNGDVTVAQTGNVTGGHDGIRAQTNGNGNIIVTTGPNATITGTSLYGIEAYSNGRGNITVTTALNDTINSGSVGINVYNQATSIPQSGGLTVSEILVTAYGTINSGMTYTGAGSRPAGILAGYRGGTTNTPNTTAFGNVTVDNFATINAAGGDGIRAYNYGPGNVTIHNNAATIVARDLYGINGSSFGSGDVAVSTTAGSITSGSHGIQAINQATAIAAPAGSTVTVTTSGTINSGVHLTGGGAQPAGIAAGYFGSNGASNPNINGSVFIDNAANISARAGTGIVAFHVGYGNLSIVDRTGTSVSGAQFGISVSSVVSGTASPSNVSINVEANATVTAGSLYGFAAINANNPTGGNISISTGSGDVIRSGGTGINANIVASSTTALSQITITTQQGTITSGYNFFQGGGTPSGISAGYNGSLNTAVHGNVVLDNSATIKAVSGAGISLNNNGVGNISATLQIASSLTAAQTGVNAFSAGGGNITVDNRGTITAGSIGINTGNGAINPSSVNGLISVINSGTVIAPGAPYMPVVTIGNANSNQTATVGNSGTIAAGLFARTTNNVAVSIFSGNGAITNSGTITGNVAFNANGIITNAIGGIWNLNGWNNLGNGAPAINNAGLMALSGVAGLSSNGTLALSNTGNIIVLPNSSAQIFANVTGAGTVTLGDRSALELGFSVASTQAINLAGRGLLTFDNPASVGSNLPLNFTSSTNGNLGSVITLQTGNITSANVVGSTLTVTGTQNYSFQVSGSGLSGNMFNVLAPNQIVLVPTTATIISGVNVPTAPPAPVNFYILDNDHIVGDGAAGFNVGTSNSIAANTYSVVVNSTSSIAVTGAVSGLRIGTFGASAAIINAAGVSSGGTGINIDTSVGGSGSGSADIVNYGNVNGVSNAIVANTVNGNINIVSGFATLTGTNSNGIFGRASGSGGINIMTSGGTINAGLIGIAAFEAQMPAGGAGGNVTVYNSSNITSGTNTAGLAGSGAAGIRAGILNNNTSVPNAAITGDVTIENRANITAQAGVGLYAYNLGSGNTSVTFAPGSYSITAVNGGVTGTGTGLTQYGIFAFTYGAGSSLVNAGWGTTITSGSTGINAGNQATVIASGSGSTVSVYSQGFISSGANVNNSGSSPSAIQAGYNPNGSGSFNKDVYGNVIVNVASDGNPFGNPSPATLLAAAGSGISAYNYGVGNIDVTVGNGVSIQALTAASSLNGGNAPYGIAATNRGPGNITVTTFGGSSINSGSNGINAVNDANPIAGSDLAALFAATPAVIAVTTSGTIHAGSQPTNSGNTPSGIAAGFFGNGGQANLLIKGSVFINNAAIVTADTGYGLQGYHFGNGNITVNNAIGANITAGSHGIYAHAEGAGTGDIAVNVYANTSTSTTITAGTASSTAYGILALSTDVGSISVITGTGATIDSHLGSAGINAVSQATSIAESVNSSVVVTNAATIHSGSGLTGFNNRPAGIVAGYIAGTTNPAPGNLANYNVHGEVVVNNFGNITADSGDGIRAYNYGVGDVTVNNFGGTITALGGVSAPNGTGVGIVAQSFGPGSVRVTTSASTSITSGSSGIAAVNKAISADPSNPSVVVPSTSTVSVLAFGTITSGTILTGSGDPAAGILAGYNPNNTNTPNGSVHGNVSIDNYANIVASAGTDGIRGVNYGTGDIMIVVEAGAGVSGGRYGAAGLGYNGGNVSITNSGTVTAATYAVIALTTGTGTAVIDNFGHVVGNASGYNATFTNELGGDWSLNGGASVFTGSSTLVNAGLIDSNGVSAISGLTGITNTGTIEVQTGSLLIGGPITGAGTVVIYGATMEFGGASDANVQFTSTASGILKLDDASHFTGTVTGFTFGDTIDLAGIAPANVTVINSGHLQVNYGTGSFELIGNYDPASFTITSDGGGGTNIAWNHQAPVILTDNLTTSFNSLDGTTTLLGVQVADSDPAGSLGTFNLTAITGAAASGTTMTPTSDSGTLAHVNGTLTTGVIYDPGNTAPATDKVTLTITDLFGATDIVNFIFNQAGTGPNIALQGTSGKDVIFATGSKDVLTGGAGQDQFLFAPVASGIVQHTITDFEAGIDRLDVRQFLSITGASIPTAVQLGNDTLITLDANDRLLLKNVIASSVQASDYLVHA